MKYKAPLWLHSGHLQSIYPSLFRRLDDSFFQRERIDTPDQDFLDLDWARIGSRRLAILCHGLEGNSRRPYMLGMARAAMRRGWDVLSWNYRSCSGETNRHLRSYHSGSTDDFDLITRYAAGQGYDEMALVGFSIGGNKTIKYLAEYRDVLPASLSAAVAFSVPCDLTSSSEHLAKPANRLYMKNFLLSLREKLVAKQQLFPDRIDLSEFNKITTFRQFDDRYTAPIHDFQGAEDYWRKSSSLYFLNAVAKPLLLVNARDDPFLTPTCFPEEEARRNPCVRLETPAYGGHVGFMMGPGAREYWSETRAMAFLESLKQS